MLGHMIGRVVNGALWGLGAAAVLAVARGDSLASRPTAKRVMMACIAAADKVQETTATTRETLEDLYAEIRAEQRLAADSPGPFSEPGLIAIMRGEREGNDGSR